MEKERKIMIIEFTVIILLWALVVFFPLLFISDIEQNWREIYVIWTECAVVGCIFLINRIFLMPRLFFRQKYLLYSASLALLFAILSVFIIYFDGVNMILSFIDEGYMNVDVAPPILETPINGMLPHNISLHNIPLHNTPPHFTPQMSAPHNITVIPPMIKVMILSVIVIALDMGLSITVKWILSEQKQAEIKKERAVAQLSNLQNQVSPHFFMNTLNNIHALVDIDSKRAKQTIIELSTLMDYLLYNNSNQDKVSLQKEIDFISNYVNLMRLRFTEQVRINFSYSKNVPTVKIPPFLFLNFIENSFKYGADSEFESFISIDFSFSENTIKMTSINSNHSQSTKSIRHGTGISNSRKRLELLYNNRYSLDIKDNEEIYSVILEIPIV